MARKLMLLACMMLVLSGCKRADWYDWKAQNEAWLAQNLINNPDIQTTASGLQYRILADPNPREQKPHRDCTVYCHYTLKLINGKVIANNEEGSLDLSTTVAGFTEGLGLIHVHGDIELWLPYSLGYGADGNGGNEGTASFIPPYSTLYFKVHIDASSAN